VLNLLKDTIGFCDSADAPNKRPQKQQGHCSLLVLGSSAPRHAMRRKFIALPIKVKAYHIPRTFADKRQLFDASKIMHDPRIML